MIRSLFEYASETIRVVNDPKDVLFELPNVGNIKDTDKTSSIVNYVSATIHDYEKELDNIMLLRLRTGSVGVLQNIDEAVYVIDVEEFDSDVKLQTENPEVNLFFDFLGDEFYFIDEENERRYLITNYGEGYELNEVTFSEFRTNENTEFTISIINAYKELNNYISLKANFSELTDEEFERILMS